MKLKIRKVLFLHMRHLYGDPLRGHGGAEQHFYRMFPVDFPDLELEHFDFVRGCELWGQQTMSAMLLECAKRFRPDLVLFTGYRWETDPLPAVFDEIGRFAITAMILGDDDWRYEDYSSKWAPHHHFMITAVQAAVEKYRRDGFGSKVIKTALAVNHHLFKPLQVEQDHDITFLGDAHGNRREVVEALLAQGLQVQTYGARWRPGSSLPLNEVVRMYGRSRISLNLTAASTVTVNAIKGRTFEVPACRGFPLHGPAPDIEKYFEPDREIVLWNSLDELIEKARFYLRNESGRRAIAERAHKRLLAEHTYTRRWEANFRAMGLAG